MHSDKGRDFEVLEGGDAGFECNERLYENAWSSAPPHPFATTTLRSLRSAESSESSELRCVAIVVRRGQLRRKQKAKEESRKEAEKAERRVKKELEKEWKTVEDSGRQWKTVEE
eukprot:Skav220118  [mRNA]  locus=scaffold1078:18309:19832:- [translate_table: standard]